MVNLSEYYIPHEGQKKIHKAREWAQYIIVCLGRRYGKSRLGIFDMLDSYLSVCEMERDRSLIPPFLAWIIVPAYTQAGQVWAELHQLVPPDFIYEAKEASLTMYLRGPDKWQGRPGLVQIKSAVDPASLQTVGLDYLWFNEAQDIDSTAQERAWAALRSPGRLGRVYAEGIPATYADHWFERTFKYALRETPKKTKDGYFGYHATTFENPFLTDRQKEEIEKDREVMSATSWERYYLAKFDVNAGYFRNVDGCIQGDILKDPIPGRAYVGGLDIGRADDPTVLYVVDRDSRKVATRMMWDNTVPWPTVHDHLLAIHDTWALTDLVIDASSLGGKFVEEDLKATVLPITSVAIVGSRRQELLERLAGALERETLHYPPIPELLRQLRAMQYRRLSDGTYRLQVPSGEHDDDIFSLALALGACAEPHLPGGGKVTWEPYSYAVSQYEADGGAASRLKGPGIMRERHLDMIEQRSNVVEALEQEKINS